MEATTRQLQQQIEFAKGILDIMKRNEANIPEERVADAKSAEAYCESVIKSCELAAELLDMEAAAKKTQAASDTNTTTAEEPAEKPKRPRKKKKEEPAPEPVAAEPEPAAQPAADDLDDLF